MTTDAAIAIAAAPTIRVLDTRFPAATAGVAASLIRVPPIADLVSVLTCATFRKSFIIYLLPPAQGKEEGGGLEVAGPGLGGGQVAILRPHAASTGYATKAAYSCLRRVYVRQGTKLVRAPTKRRTSENAQKAKFAEFLFHALR